MAIAIYPGSFDPVHLGHVQIVETAATIFDQLIVVAMHNREKKDSCLLKNGKSYSKLHLYILIM